ncbi:MAG: aminopeptidase [Christensenellaceae bacterium]
MTKEELKAHGLNDSMTHVDFMVGSKIFPSSAQRTTEEIKVFENGNFVI